MRFSTEITDNELGCAHLSWTPVLPVHSRRRPTLLVAPFRFDVHDILSSVHTTWRLAPLELHVQITSDPRYSRLRLYCSSENAEGRAESSARPNLRSGFDPDVPFSDDLVLHRQTPTAELGTEKIAAANRPVGVGNRAGAKRPRRNYSKYMQMGSRCHGRQRGPAPLRSALRCCHKQYWRFFLAQRDVRRRGERTRRRTETDPLNLEKDLIVVIAVQFFQTDLLRLLL